jgi:hypothetical protein
MLFMSCFVLPVALLGVACDQKQTDESVPDALPSNPDGEDPLLLPSDDKCLGESLTADEAKNLCKWGTSVLGSEGTILQAACIDVVYDAGVKAAPAMMADMIVLSQANCIAKIRTAYSTDCAYTVGQFKQSIEGFHAGTCSGASLNVLIGYKNMPGW